MNARKFLLGLSLRPPPPQVWPLPDGWRYAAKTSEIPKGALPKAQWFLYHSKLGEFYDGEGFKLIKEWHYDNHVSKEAKWHPGVSVVIPA